MTLQNQLDAYKRGMQAKAPAEALAIMQRATADLRASGIMAQAAQPGDPAPDFTARNAADQSFNLKDLCAAGPVVLGFYRGIW